MSSLDDLFSAWLTDTLTPEGSRELQELLREPHQRRRWRALADLEGALAEVGAAVQGEPAEASPVTTQRRRIRPTRPAQRRTWPYVLAASLLLALGGVWLLLRTSGADLPSQGGHRLAHGEKVSGPARLLWMDGSQVDLSGDARALVLESGKGLRLQHGRLEADIAPQQSSQAFTVRSAQALVRVIGTRFSVSCEAQATTLQVAHGRVAFTPEGSAEQIVTAGGSAVAGLMQPPPAVKGLVGWWPLDEAAGAIAHDRSGQGHDGRIVGALWTDQGLRFAGGDDRVDIAPVGALAKLQAGDYSLAAWYRPDQLPQAGDPADPTSARDSAAVIVGRSGWHLGLCLDQQGQFSMHNIFANQDGSFATSSPLAAPGRWFHLVGVVERSRGQTTLLVNGTVVATTVWPAGTAAIDYPAAKLWRIGIGEPGNQQFRWPCSGHIREVRFYDRALAGPEITALAGAR